MDAQPAIRAAFAEQFAYWGIELPLEPPPSGERGALYQGGWTIYYHFGEADDRPYLEYYASHRMTNETLCRIYADGRFEQVAQIWEFYPADDEAARQQVHDNNTRFYERVKELGLI